MEWTLKRATGPLHRRQTDLRTRNLHWRDWQRQRFSSMAYDLGYRRLVFGSYYLVLIRQVPNELVVVDARCFTAATTVQARSPLPEAE